MKRFRILSMLVLVCVLAGCSTADPTTASTDARVSPTARVAEIQATVTDEPVVGTPTAVQRDGHRCNGYSPCALTAEEAAALPDVLAVTVEAVPDTTPTRMVYRVERYHLADMSHSTVLMAENLIAVGISPSGKRLAYSVVEDSLTPDPEGHIYILDMETGKTELVYMPRSPQAFQTQGIGGGISWSPDEKRLAYICFNQMPGQEKSTVGLCIISLDEPTEKKTVKMIYGLQEGLVLYPKWAPTGEWIMVEPERYNGEKKWTVVVARADEGDVRELNGEYERGYAMGSAFWAPDGESVYVFGKQENYRAILTLDLSGLRVNAEPIVWFDLPLAQTKDGKWFLIKVGHESTVEEVMVRSRDGAFESVFGKLVPGELFVGLMWVEDGD